MRKIKLLVLFLIFTVLLTSGFGCKGGSTEAKAKMKPVTLSYWRVFDESDDFAEVLAAYKELHPNITIDYRKLRFDEYEKELLEAFATDKGPDIFSIHNTWMKKYKEKELIQPLPPTTEMAFQFMQGTIKKEPVVELRTSKSVSLKDIRDNYVDAVAGDVIMPLKDAKTNTEEDRIFGLPLALDTMVMYYNKDLLNNSGIAQVPKYWNKEFNQAVKKLTKFDVKGNVIQSAVSLGGGRNIERYSDILALIMMQNGTVMMNDQGQITFASIPETYRDKSYNPGLEALNFYTGYANPSKEVYTWNKDLPNSLDMFISGKLAIFFGYAYHLPTIRARAPKLNFSFSAVPQIEGNQPVNFANYWVETASKKTKYSNEAWDFLQFATRAQNVRSYLDKTKKPTALRALVNEQLDKKDVDVFASQVLTAKSWYHGMDAPAAEQIIAEMIDTMQVSPDKPINVLNTAASRVQQTVNIAK